MPDPAVSPKSTMEAITEAVTLGRSGEVDTARDLLLKLWREIGVLGDPLHRCALAHHLADLYDDPVESLVWDLRALDAADAVTDERVQAEHAGLVVAGLYPSLHLNLADDCRRLGSFDAARRHLTAAEDHAPHLDDDPYGRMIRAAIVGVAEAVGCCDTSPRQPPVG